MQRITPFLLFENQAEEAANFYVSLFDNSRIKDVTRYDEAGIGRVRQIGRNGHGSDI